MDITCSNFFVLTDWTQGFASGDHLDSGMQQLPACGDPVVMMTIMMQHCVCDQVAPSLICGTHNVCG